MNIRKPTDYSEMFSALDDLMQKGLPQMDLFLAVGKEIDSRQEKGAAVAASEYIRTICPGITGFSPRGVRRMREFYRAYKNNSMLMHEALKISWTHNALILEKCDSDQERLWYIQAVQRLGWSKQTLETEIAQNAYQKHSGNISEEYCENGYSARTEKTGFRQHVRKALKRIRWSMDGVGVFPWLRDADISQRYLQERNPPNRGTIFRICGAQI